MDMGIVYHKLAEEIEALKRSHCLRTSLRISESYMCLSTHLVAPHGNDIENRAIAREQGVERKPQVGFVKLFRKIGQVESVREQDLAAGRCQTREILTGRAFQRTYLRLIRGYG